MTFQNGDSIGRYHILEPLGEGGMALVYKAYDTRLERNVALKVIRSTVRQDARFLRRFEREAQALAALSHPNIVKVLDYGEYEGSPFLVMEYIPGGTLKERIQQGALEPRRALEITLALCKALAHAHQHGIVHRDVKPSNVLITPDGQPLLSDFGIAKMLEGEQTVDLTGTGVGVGTPEYMAPEQGLGKGVDARTDVYSLGVVLYEMVTGRKPYQADTPLAVMLMQMNNPLPSPRQFAPSLPESVEQILFKALAKAKEDRFQSMAEFAEACEAALAGATTLRLKIPAQKKAPRRLRWWLAPIGLLGLAGAVIACLVAIELLGRINTADPTLTAPVPNTAAPVQTLPPTAAPSALPTAAPTALPSPAPTATAKASATPAAALRWTRLASTLFTGRDTIQAIVVELTDPEVIYTALESAGIYKTLNGGISWQPAHNGLGSAQVTSLALNPANPRLLLAATSLGGIYRSIDGAASWQPANQGISLENVVSGFGTVLFDPTNPSRAYAAPGSDAVYRSTDQGATWQRVNGVGFRGNIVRLQAHPKQAGVLFAAVYLDNAGGIYRSDDFGATWSLVSPPNSFMYRARFVVDAVDGSHLYLSAEDNLFRYSTDGGKTWQQGAQGGAANCWALAVHPKNPAEVYCVAVKENILYKSTDSGRTWTQLQALNPGNYHAIAFSAVDPQTLYLGGNGFFLSSDGGRKWSERSSGLGGAYIQLRFNPRSPAWGYLEQGLFAGSHRLFYTRDAGKTWKDSPDFEFGLALDADGKTLYTSRGNSVYRSQDGGASWQAISTPVSGENWSGLIAGAHPQKPGVVYLAKMLRNPGGGRSELWRSDDFGVTWKQTGWDGQVGHFLALAADPNTGKTVYAMEELQVYRSEEEGATWTACGATAIGGSKEKGVAYMPEAVSRLGIDPSNPQRIYLATRGMGVLASKDGCRTWTPANLGLESLFVNSLLVDPLQPMTLYAGTDSGVFLSTDGGSEWQPASDGLLGALVVYSLAYQPEEQAVYAATPYGIFRLSVK